jgi:hypothetical protein
MTIRGRGWHQMDVIRVRLAENDGGSVIVISNLSTGLTVLFAVDIDLANVESTAILAESDAL